MLRFSFFIISEVEQFLQWLAIWTASLLKSMCLSFVSLKIWPVRVLCTTRILTLSLICKLWGILFQFVVCLSIFWHFSVFVLATKSQPFPLWLLALLSYLEKVSLTPRVWECLLNRVSFFIYKRWAIWHLLFNQKIIFKENKLISPLNGSLVFTLIELGKADPCPT